VVGLTPKLKEVQMREWINFEEYWDYRMSTPLVDQELVSKRKMDEEYESMMSYLHDKYSETNPNITTVELEQILNQNY
jgi:hypothetical protein